MAVGLAAFWLILTALLLGTAFFSATVSLPLHHLVYLALTMIMSVVCFVMYFVDKRNAQRGAWRIPEKTLHTLEALGGWPGALLGQQWFRHKTQKTRFKIILWLIVLGHVVAVAYVGYRALLR